VDIRPPEEGGQIRLNLNQPRNQAHWKSKALENQILQARGLFTPPLVMPTDEATASGRDVYEVIDAHRRITALREILRSLKARLEQGTLSEDEYEEQSGRYSKVTVECTWRRLEQEELIKVWLLIHRERKEWTVSEREETAKQLINLVSVSRAAQFLGVSEAVAQKLADTYDLAQRIKLPDQHNDALGKDPRITWARELRNLRADVRDDDELMDAVISRINAGRIKNSKDIRVLRNLGDDARDEILDPSKDLVRDIAEPRGVKDPVRATTILPPSSSPWPCRSTPLSWASSPRSVPTAPSGSKPGTRSRPW
jgi:ParB family chromosome partitioning protein